MTDTSRISPDSGPPRRTWRIAMSVAAITLSLVATQARVTAPNDENRGLFDNFQEGDDLNAKINALTKEQISQLRLKEVARLIKEPLDKVALRNLTTLESLAKNSNAEQLAIESATRTYRDPQNQILAVHYLIKRGQLDESLDKLDGLLRARPKLANELFPILFSIVENKKVEGPLIQLLKSDPPWRASFINYAISTSDGLRRTYDLLTALRTAKDPSRPEELRAVLKKLVVAKNYEAAYFIWLDFLTAEELLRVAQIFDGEFSLPIRNLLFDWTFALQKNVTMQVAAKPGSPGDKALKVDFYGFSGSFSQVSQFLKLDPGSHRFAFESLADTYKSEGGLQWRVRCADNPAILGQSEAIRQNSTWKAYGFEVLIPNDNCLTQILRLESASKVKLDNRMDGQVYFDNFVVTPTDIP